MMCPDPYWPDPYEETPHDIPYPKEGGTDGYDPEDPD